MRKIGEALFSAYFIAAMLSASYFNWQFAAKHGFAAWLFLGELVPTAQGLIWPYYAYGRFAAPKVSDLERQTAARLLIGLNAATRSAELIAKWKDQPSAIPQQVRDEAYGYRATITMVAEGLNVEVANEIYPELGTVFYEKLYRANQLSQQATAEKNLMKFVEAYRTAQEFTDWFNPRVDEIKKALQKYAPSQSQ